ncbi:MAG: response regulator transcription factor [Bacteroidetes bacterium]|nr:MAG: response regulator transcription factor [Bacteroidota bacterium]
MNQERKFLIADDHTVVRKGLIQILMDQFPLVSFTEVNDGNELLLEARKGNWDIIITDLSMPGRNGLDTLKQLHTEKPSIPVLVLSIHSEDQYAVRVLKAGASGYLTKESAPDELVKAVLQILNGHKYINTSVAEKLLDSIEKGHSGMPHEQLSDREFDVLRLIASGKSVTEIADNLSLSVNTISTYRMRLLEKMRMKSSAELTHYAISNHLLE